MLKHRVSKDGSLNGRRRYSNGRNGSSASQQSSSFDLSEDEQVKSGIQPDTRRSSLFSSNNFVGRRLSSYSSETIDESLRLLTDKYEISDDFANRLRALQHFKIILLCDDSGSMNTTVDNGIRTRWDELKSFVDIVLLIGIIFDPDGIDIYFLNREPLLNVTDPQRVEKVFETLPHGVTPLVDALRSIFRHQKTYSENGRKTLVFIATDGAPTDRRGKVNVEELKHVMNNEREVETTYVTFLICTDDDTCVEYLNEWDRTMINVDVTDDFKTEREQIWQAQGRDFSFTKGEYIVKALVGAIDPYMDDLDEKRTHL